MALVSGQQMPGRLAVGADRGDDLFGLALRDARIIFSGDHHQRNINLAGPAQRADFLHFRTLLGEAFVAIFRSPQITAIGLGVFQEGDETGDADHLQPSLEPVAVAQHRSQCHIAAIAAAGDGDTLAVNVPVLAQMVQKGADIEHAVLAQPGAVVQRQESFAETGRSADIGVKERDAELVDQIIVAPQKMRLRLAFRAAVDMDDQRPFALVAGGVGPVQITGHFFAVEAGDLDQFRRHIGGGVETAGLAPGPAGDRQCLRVDAIGVAAGAVAVERYPQFSPRREFDPADHAGRQAVRDPNLAALRIIEF